MEKKKNDEIIISKSKLLKVVGIVIGLVLFFGICFAVSSSNSEEYKESTTTTSDSSSDDSTYDTAVKEAANVKDSERTSPHEISIGEYLELYKESGKKLVLISRPTCQYCQIATPIIENIIYEYKVDINYLNTDELGDDGNSELVSSDDYFSEGYGTPLLLVVGDGAIVDKVEGLTSKSQYINFFKEYGFMEG